MARFTFCVSHWQIALLSAVLLASAPLAKANEWNVIDGDWCYLVLGPLPEIPLPAAPQVASATTPPASDTVAAHSAAVPSITTETFAPSSSSSASASAGSGDDGFVSLFNGKDLDGWIVQGLEKAGPKVKEGVMEVGGWDYWAVITKEDFGNFILRFDVKYDAKGNSGILLHTDKKQVYKTAPEIQLRADEGESAKDVSGAIFDKGGLKVPATVNASKPVGEWNQVEIRYEHPKIWVTINGKAVQDGVDLSQVDGLMHKNQKGSIAIQRNDYKKAAYFKDIKVKRLPD